MSKTSEALDILKQFNVPKKQQNERSALALLALLNLKEKDTFVITPAVGLESGEIRIHGNNREEALNT